MIDDAISQPIKADLEPSIYAVIDAAGEAGCLWPYSMGLICKQSILIYLVRLEVCCLRKGR
jgi:hypothetical protein